MGPRLPRELFLDMDLSPQQQKRSWSKNGLLMLDIDNDKLVE